MNHEDMLARLRQRVADAGSQLAFSKQQGVSLSHLNDALRGEREPGPKILRAIGLRRVPMFEEIADGA